MSFKDKLLQRLKNNLFRKVKGVRWNPATGGMGVATKDNGIRSLIKEGGTYHVQDGLDLISFELPAFGQRVALSALSKGDLIVSESGRPSGWVIDFTTEGEGEDQKRTKVRIMSVNGKESTVNPVSITSGFGDSSGEKNLMVVKNLFNLTGASDGNQLQNMLLPLLLLGKGDGDLDNLLPIFLMSQQGGGEGGMFGGMNMQNMLPMMLMGGSGGISDLFGGGSSGVLADTSL